MSSGDFLNGSECEGADYNTESDKNEHAHPLGQDGPGAFAPIEIDAPERDEFDEMMADPSANGVKNDADEGIEHGKWPRRSISA